MTQDLLQMLTLFKFLWVITIFKRFKVKNANATKKNDAKWIVFIVIFTLIFTGILSVMSELFLTKSGFFVAITVLSLMVLVGLLFDVIGLAVAVADETPFHAMAARRVKGANFAIFLIRNNEKVSNFCNDVIGDIAGILSGAMSVAIINGILKQGFNMNNILISCIVTSIVAALTIGGKALCKTISISHSNSIVYFVARVATLFSFRDTKRKD